MTARILRILALVLLVAATLTWLVTGANRGWTKTKVQKRTLDEVTGIEGISYEQRFLPGVDFLVAALVGSTLLAGTSFVFRGKKPEPRL